MVAAELPSTSDSGWIPAAGRFITRSYPGMSPTPERSMQMCQGFTSMYCPLQWSVFSELAQTHWTDRSMMLVFCMLFQFLLTIIILYRLEDCVGDMDEF